MTDYTHDASQNPAAEASGKSLGELFRTDPLELTQQDREKIIETFRKERTKFLQQEEGTKKTGSRNKAASKKPKGSEGLDINLDDVEI